MKDFAIETRAMTATLVPKKLPVIYAGLVGAALTFTTVGVTPPPAPSMEFAHVWTSGVTAATRPDTANAVRDLKRRSGLSWQQLADAFGTSRRSLHFWANGGNMASANVGRLQALTQIVDGYAPANPAAVRAALLAPRSGRSSQLEELIGEVRQRRTAPRTSVATHLNAVLDDTKHPGRVISSKTVPVKLSAI